MCIRIGVRNKMFQEVLTRQGWFKAIKAAVQLAGGLSVAGLLVYRGFAFYDPARSTDILTPLMCASTACLVFLATLALTLDRGETELD